MEQEVDEIMELVNSIRRLKKIITVTYKYKPEVFLVASHTDTANKFLNKDLSQTLHILQANSPNHAVKGVEDVIFPNKVFLVVPDELRRNL